MTEQPTAERSIFLSAIEAGSPADRAAYLDRACGGDARLRSGVEELLAAHDRLAAGAPAATAGYSAGAAPGAATATADEVSGSVIGPYKLLQQIGEGGMGTVYMAEQTHPIQRKVALKIIKAGMDSRQVIARFEAERQALAMMDHVNIARVFDAGTTESGLPYFVMELVHGVPITKYCDDNHLTPRDRLELFVPVCQAIQHAHQKGIIHRDIKPSNVMVTLYDGKPVPKVIDFGVAKATEQKLTERTLFTQYGSVVGTLEYMSPEQAEMSALGVDTRSDIFSLGVLLYELLTGNTPLTHKRMKEGAYAEILRMIKEEEPPKPSTRLSDSGEALASISANRHMEPAKLTKLMRGELDWIVMKTLEKDRNRRYETANGFVADVQRYLSDEAVQACPPSARYRLRKFARRNKRGLATAAVLGVILLLAIGGVAGSIGWAVRNRSAREAEAVLQQTERHAKVASQVDLIFTEVDRLEREQKWPEALVAARRVGAAVAGGEADAATAQRVRKLLKDLEFIDRLEQIRMQWAATVEGKFDYAGLDREYARAFRDYGVDALELPVETSIDRLKARPALAIPIAAALDDWVSVRRVVSERDEAGWKRLVAVARGIDPELLRDRLRSTWGQAVTPEVQDELRRLAGSINIRAQHPATLVILARTLERVKHSDSALRLLRDAQSVHPGDFWINFELGFALTKQKDHEGAIRYYTAAVSIRPNSAAANHNLGFALGDQNLRTAVVLETTDFQQKLDEAIASYRKAIEFDPKYAVAYHGLGNALYAQKKRNEAIAAYRKAIELEPKDAITHGNLGLALQDQKKLDEAIAAYRKAIELDPKYADAHRNLGHALREQGKLDEAIACYKKAIELEPKFAMAHDNLGGKLTMQGKLDEAVACHKKAIELEPTNVSAYTNLGVALYAQQKLDEAIACYRKALELKPKFATAHFNLGNALSAQQKPDEAIAAYRKAIELDPKYADAHRNLGHALSEQGKLDEAIACYKKAIELEPKNSSTYSNLGVALRQQLKLDEAIAAYRKAIELDPKSATAYINLGVALSEQQNLDEAIAAYRKAIELDPKNAAAYTNLGAALYAQQKLDEAIAAYKKAIELEPNFAIAYYNLGNALQSQGKAQREQKKLDEASAAYRKAIELEPIFANAYIGLARAYTNLGVALHAQQKLDEAIACYKKAIEIDPKNARDYTNLGAALYAQKKLDEAIAAYRKAIELDPKSATAYINLGAILCDHLRDYDKAIECFRKAIELDPKDANANRNLGVALGKKGWDLANNSDPKLRDPKRAIEAVTEAIELNSQMARQYLGWIHYRTGDWKSSIEALEKACKLQKGGTGDAGQWIVMSLAHANLAAQDGVPNKARALHKMEAQRRFDQADKQIDSWWRVRPGDTVGQAIWDFRAEARELMGTNDGKR